MSIDEKIREILDKYGRLLVDSTQIQDRDDLYQLGLSSHASVNVMLAVEESFDIEFPEHLLRRSTFSSLASIRAAVGDVSSAAHS